MAALPHAVRPEVAVRLEQTSFASLTPFLPAVLVEWKAIRIDRDFPSYRTRLAGRYEELTSFYRVAARDNECTIFWAA
ncbi:YfbM family protein [Actinoplanes sp. KI2]|uniref:YfbM family protein n=1 Tax=Actinoplanes sp. KI2 TaxID=2983315 RepID=UPI0021D60B51|nr:YfbM family protein [Actinoplanes sp. KI2]MCU7726451.1 YfbM family protein [Actinoplanes sp. KI2]